MAIDITSDDTLAEQNSKIRKSLHHYSREETTVDTTSTTRVRNAAIVVDILLHYTTVRQLQDVQKDYTTALPLHYLSSII